MKPCVNLRQQSNIYIGPTADLLPGLLPEGVVVVIIDSIVRRLYPVLVASHKFVEIEVGEQYKSMRTIEMIYKQFMEMGVDRSTFVLAIGGGILTDIAGFAASTYMRGVRFGFVSTTLLGQVDASIGGKNGVNIDGYKNMAGTFTLPQFVICDPTMLRTLPLREFRAGMAEVVKSAIIADADLFARLEATSLDALLTDSDLLSDAISASVRVKSDIVERDLMETDERRKLNLGHTMAHAIEKCSTRMNHGEAVAVGTALIASAAVKLGLLKPEDRDRIIKLLSALGFDLTPPVAIERLLEEVSRDKKGHEGQLRIVVPVGIGDCEILPISQEDFAALF